MQKINTDGSATKYFKECSQSPVCCLLPNTRLEKIQVQGHHPAHIQKIF